MFAGGDCCTNGYWCYEGNFCSTKDPNDQQDGDVSCCADSACATTIGLANINIYYSDQPGYGSGAAPTSTVAGQGETTSSGSATVTQTTTSHGFGNTASNLASSASPTTSKSAGQVARKANILGGLYLTPLVVALFGVELVW
jgi:hypothetical protein